MALKKKYYALGLDEEEEKKGSSSSKSTVKAAKTEQEKETAKAVAKTAAAVKTAATLKAQAKADALKAQKEKAALSGNTVTLPNRNATPVQLTPMPNYTGALLGKETNISDYVSLLNSSATTALPTVTSNDSWLDFVQKRLKQGMAYAQQGPQTRQQIADELLSGNIWDVNKGDVDSLDYNTLRQMQINNQYYKNQHQQAGTFDSPEFLTSKYITLPGTEYLTAQEQTALAALEESKKKDEEAKAANSYRVNSWQHWSDMQNRLGEMTEDNAPYFYAYADYLTKGDFSTPFNMDDYDAMWNEMDDDAYWADMAAKEKAFNALDWDTLTDKSAERTAYESQTPALQETYDLISGEVATRKRVAELEAGIRSNPDYGSLSQYQGMENINYQPKYNDVGSLIDAPAKNKWVGNYTDLLYFINNGADYSTIMAAADRDASVMNYVQNGYHLMTDEEKATYTAYMQAGLVDEAAEYLSLKRPDLLARKAAIDAEAQETMATNSWLAGPMYLGSLAAGVLSPLQLVQQGYEALTGQDDPNSAASAMSRFQQNVRAAQEDWIGEAGGPSMFGKTLWQWLYGGVSGAFDNAARIAVYGPAGSLAAAGAQSAAGSLQENAARDDMSGAAKIAQALLTGGMEIGTEKIGLDALFDKGKKNAFNYIKGVIGSELGEETLNYLSDDAIDMAVSLIFDHEADIKSAPEFWQGLGETAITTLISSGLMGGGGAITQHAATSSTGKAINANGDVQAILDIAQSMPEGSESYRISKDILEGQKKSNRGISNYQMGKLTQALAGELNEEQAAIIDRVQDDAIVSRLEELGDDSATAKKNAPIIRKLARGQVLTMGEKNAVAWNDNATQVVQELTRETDIEDSQRTGNKWVTDLNTAQAQATSEVDSKQARFQLATITPVGKAANRAAEAAKDKILPSGGKAKPTDTKVSFHDDAGAKVEGNLLRLEELDGKMLAVIQTGKGKTTTEQKVDIRNFDGAAGAGVATILEYITDEQLPHSVTAEEANTLLQSYQTHGGNAKGFIEAFDVNYLAGYSGINEIGSVLDPTLSKLAYENGQRDAAADEEERKTRASTYKALENPVTGWIGKVESRDQVKGLGDVQALEEALEAMPESQRTAAEVMLATGKEVGLNVVLFDSDGKGAANDIQNGMFDATTHTVYFDVSAWIGSQQELETRKKEGTLGYALLRVGGHELTHYLEVAAPEAYAKYAQAVKDALKQKGQDFAVLMRGKIDNANAQGRKLTMAGAAAEVIADASEDMLQDSKLVNNLDSSTKGKIRAFIQNFAQKVKEIFRHLTGGHKESAALRELKDGVYHYMEGLQELWDAGFEEILAKGTEDLADGAAEMVEGQEVKNSDREVDVSYDALVNKPDMQLTVLTDDIGSRDRAAIINAGYENAKENGVIGKSGMPAVYVKDIGREVHVSKKSLGHGLDRRTDQLSAATQHAGELLQNAILINTATPKLPAASESYILLSAGENPDGTITPVSFVVNSFTNELETFDVLKSMKQKQNQSRITAGIGANALLPTDSTISIAELVNLVKNDFTDLWSNDVIAKLGLPRKATEITPSLKYSDRDTTDQTETAASVYERYREVSMRLNKAREKRMAAKKTWDASGEMNAVLDLIIKDQEAGANAYRALMHKYGLDTENVDELQKEANELYKRWEQLNNQELEEKEKNDIERSGKSVAEYYRDKAVKEFGYTPYFYDAGYLLPNGKTLNFSGEKGRHYGSRGQDHRAIGAVYANKTGSEAMISFMHEGNIRIMPEAPGIDIASTIEPTAQQYLTLKKFVREYSDEDYLNIDFTDENGNVVANLEYEGNIRPERVVNDIKHYYQTGEIREQGLDAFRYSERDLPESISIREYLGAMKPTSSMNETEKILLKRYQDQLRTLEEKEKLVAEQEEIIRTAPFRNPDGSINDEITKAKNRYKIYRDQANRAARALMDAERNDGFARLMATSRQVVNDYLLGAAGNVADAQDALETEIKELTKQLTALESTVTRTASGQRAAFARGLYNPSDLKAAAQKLKDTYGSRMSVNTIADRLALVFGELYANEGAEGAKLFMAAAKDLAADLLAGNKFRYQSEILPMLREQIGTISLSDTDLQEIENAGLTMTEYKRMLNPYIKVTAGGSDLSSYASNAEYYGNGALAAVLGDGTEGNLAMRLYDVISQEKAKEADNGYDGMSESQLIGMAMADIAGANLPVSANIATTEYLRKELLKYAGENADVAIKVEEAIDKAKRATARAGSIWREAARNTETARDAVAYYRALDEKRRVMELAEQKKQITEQLKSDTAEKLKEKIDKQRQEYREREQKARAYRKSRNEVDKLRRRIGRELKRLNNLRVNETDKRHIPQELQHMVDTLMETVTEGEIATLAFPEAKVLRLNRVYTELKKSETDATHFWDDEIETDMRNLYALSEQYTALRNREDAALPYFASLEGAELEYSILQSVDAIVGNVLQMVDNANRSFLNGREETFNQFAKKAGEKLRGRKNREEYTGVRGKLQSLLDTMLVNGNLTPIYYFEHLDNPELLDVFNEIRNGQNEYARIIAEGKRFMEEARAKYNYGAWVADGRLTMKTSNGHTIELTREEAAEIYAIAKREKANKIYQTEHLKQGGFQYKHREEHKSADGKTLVDNTPHQLDAADIAKIESWLTAEQKAYADALVGFLSTTMADYGNEAAMAMYGYKKFTESYYIPFHTVANQRYQRGDEGPQGENAGTGRVKNSGFTHKVQHKANQPLYVGGISETVEDHIHKMAAYAAMVQPIENMKRLLNHQVLENDGTSNTIRALIGQKYGQASEDYLTQLLKDLNGATQSDNRASEWTDQLIGAFKRGAVMASASVVLQQPTAVARAMAYISPKYFRNNPFYRPSKGTWDEMLKHSGTAIIKDMGKFDVGMGLSATQYIGDEDLSVRETYRRLRAEGKGKGVAGKAAMDRFFEWLTSAPGAADQWTWGLIWQANKAKQAELHPEMDVRSDAFLDLCGRTFDDVIDHTQVYDSVLTKSNLMRSQNGWHKAATSFMSEPTLSLNMLYDALTGIKSKRYTPAQRGRIVGSVVASQVLAGALAALVQAWNDDDDERNWLEKYADKATGNILDNLNVLNMIPYVSDVISMFEGYGVERPDMSVLKDVMDYTSTFFGAFEDGGAPTWKQTENFVGTLANLLGIPAKNISREVRRTWNAITHTDWTAPSSFGVGQAVLENTWFNSGKKKDYYQRIVTAEIRGDEELAEDLRSYMLASKGVDEDALTKGIREAYQERYEEGGIEKQDATRFLLDNGLVTGDTEEERKKSAFQYVDKWEEGTTNYSAYNTLKAAFAAINYTDIKKAWKELTDNGYTDKQVGEQSRTLIKQLVQDGTINTYQATELLRKWCSYEKDSDNVEKPKEWLANKK